MKGGSHFSHCVLSHEQHLHASRHIIGSPTKYNCFFTSYYIMCSSSRMRNKKLRHSWKWIYEEIESSLVCWNVHKSQS